MNGKTGFHIGYAIGGADLRMTRLTARACRAAGSAWCAVANWFERRRQRRHLGELEEHMLRDIGVTRAQAREQARRWLR
ncbi:DUF1127 domain-containing protein [Hoeflea sp. G2-23]|uniref:DUF1127 domain-containing protein n=1 Tax=Hoeflea algicola TaxID=2983763 RepID=A0ABT3Z676_9HYPH|nr:DUF1127 domain-containing protein [Hoeflea algicola]MCY0147268.1 DUF1127 domain-containing protein [Hoeflea algicola]